MLLPRDHFGHHLPHLFQFLPAVPVTAPIDKSLTYILDSKESWVLYKNLNLNKVQPFTNCICNPNPPEHSEPFSIHLCGWVAAPLISSHDIITGSKQVPGIKFRLYMDTRVNNDNTCCNGCTVIRSMFTEWKRFIDEIDRSIDIDRKIDRQTSKK